jgi:hypothetical protein
VHDTSFFVLTLRSMVARGNTLDHSAKAPARGNSIISFRPSPERFDDRTTLLLLCG